MRRGSPVATGRATPFSDKVAPMNCSFSCPNCAKRYDVKGDLAGKRVRCSGCGHVFRVPDTGTQSSGVAAPAPSPPAGSSFRDIVPLADERNDASAAPTPFPPKPSSHPGRVPAPALPRPVYRRRLHLQRDSLATKTTRGRRDSPQPFFNWNNQRPRLSLFTTANQLVRDREFLTCQELEVIVHQEVR